MNYRKVLLLIVSQETTEKIRIILPVEKHVELLKQKMQLRASKSINHIG